MDYKKASVDGKIRDVIDYSELPKINTNNYDNLAVLHNGVIYPERNPNVEISPGLYVYEWGTILHEPTEEQLPEYLAENKLIDFKANNIRELIEKSDRLKEAENTLLVCTDPEGITTYPIGNNDSPEMVAVKSAINAKHIDIKKYQARWDTYANDIRLLNKESLSLAKLKTFAKNLDMKVSIVVEDKSPNVPNPIGDKIVIDIVGGD